MSRVDPSQVIPSQVPPSHPTEDGAATEIAARIAELERETRRLRAALDQARGSSGDADHPFRGLADAAPAMLWVTDRTGECVFLSRSWSDFTGQDPEDGLGFGWLDVVHPDDRVESERIFRQASERQEPFSIDHRLRLADGGYRWVIDEGRPRFGPDGEWQGYIGSVIDVHDRKIATDALRQSERRYRTLFKSIDEGFCVIEMIFDAEDRPVDYRFIEVNPAFEKHTGLEGAVGKTAREMFPTLESHWFEMYGRIATTGLPARFENSAEPMGRWYDVYGFRVDAPKKRRVALLFTDVTEQKRAEQERDRLFREMEAAKAEAESANRAKAEFLAAMSHELRTPLNAIGGYVQLLEIGVHGPVSPPQMSALERISANQRHLLSLINDILSFARVEAGSLDFDIQPLSALAVLESLEPLVAPQAEARGVAYTLRGCDENLRLLGDSERVRQILLNLVGNAIKFTPEGGWVVLSGEEDGEWVSLEVRDNGIGIAPAEQERIFDPFQQLGRMLNRPKDGVGLGLAISRDLARAMGGDLAVSSTLGQGSTFTLRLPAGEGGS